MVLELTIYELGASAAEDGNVTEAAWGWDAYIECPVEVSSDVVLAPECDVMAECIYECEGADACNGSEGVPNESAVVYATEKGPGASEAV